MNYLPEMLRKRVASIAVREYAALSWCYYKHDVSPKSDAEFDELCAWLLKEYRTIKPWDINDYLDESALKAGTGYHLVDKIGGHTLELAQVMLKEAQQRQELLKAGAPSAGKLAVRKKDDDDDLEALLGKVS